MKYFPQARQAIIPNHVNFNWAMISLANDLLSLSVNGGRPDTAHPAVLHQSWYLYHKVHHHSHIGIPLAAAPAPADPCPDPALPEAEAAGPNRAFEG
jgi:hypothetical protein